MIAGECRTVGIDPAHEVIGAGHDERVEKWPDANGPGVAGMCASGSSSM